MSDEQINIAIAEACGWKPAFLMRDMAGNPFPGQDIPPDYCNDLNAMREAEKTLNYEQAELFEDKLCDICVTENEERDNPLPYRFAVAHATARQRAEAFLRTTGKWEGAK